ncbi:MAG TPA: DNA recombination protein RmuC [Gaiella sp.]|jgi:DNA recombination protein RmuC|nr:DNA recombination protein RmuC [Gaiella sp.]
MTIAALLIGLVVGAGGVLFLLRSSLAERRARGDRVLELERELAGASARLEAAERSFDASLADAVRAASAEAFRDSGTRYLDAARGQLESTVAPLKQSLQDVGLRVQELDRAREQAYGALRQQVSLLSERTGNLANALRSPSVRGRWGEAQLRNVVELAGMLEHCDFVAQASTRDADGDLLRPDLVVRIPGGKQVVVDAKVPLAAYLEAFETSGEEERAARLAAHARQVRDHATKLAAKAYWRQFAPTPDFVVMFVPDETLLRVAHEHDRRLGEDAWAQGVVLASPSTLMTLLRTVAAVWQQETVARSAREVHELGAELHKRLGTFAGHLAKVGRSLDGAVGAYNEAVGSFESRVLVQARRLEEHGVAGELESPSQIERQARAVGAGEPDEAPVVELPRDAHAA